MFREVLKVPYSILFHEDNIPENYNDLSTETKRNFLTKRLSDYLLGIGKNDLILFCIRVLNFDQHNSIYHSPETFTKLWFSNDNIPYANIISERLKFISKDNNIELINFNHTSSLSLLEYILLNITDSVTTKNITDKEIDLLKAYTIETEILDLEEENINNFIFEKDDIYKRQLLALTFHYNDYINYDVNTVLISQTIKSDMFFDFLQQNEMFSKVLSLFLQKYNLEDAKEYRRVMLQLGSLVYKKEASNDSKIREEPIIIEAQGNNLKKSIQFLTKFSIDTEEYILKNDFISIRNTPLYKDESGKYLIIFGLFILEKIFKSLYWNILRLAQTDCSEIKNPKSEIGLHFSENYLTSKTLDIIFEPSDYYKLNSAAIRALSKKNNGEPDYYARKNNVVFLFESKDASINSDYKTEEKKKLNYQELEKEFIKKFYKNQVGDPKAVLQLINNCLKVLNKSNAFDKNYDETKVLIYPVLIVHDNSFNALGFNKLLDSWFREKLNEELAKLNIHPERIFQLTVIDIDCLIRFQEYFRKGIVTINDMLYKYYFFCINAPATKEGVMQSLSSFSKFLHEYITTNFSPIAPKGFEII